MNKNIKLKHSVLALAVTSALISPKLSADQQFDTITVTGERISLSETNINQEHLEKSQASDLKDVFKNEADISVGGASTVSQKVYVRDLRE
ncbi:hypothetical protein [Psychromonas sp. KJ10-2]|uniref:hypothetical protein n=1 Tax=Psychromonas sp. KJ10-2 TaxID=3391822 RepID=UPI0039B39443